MRSWLFLFLILAGLSKNGNGQVHANQRTYNGFKTGLWIDEKEYLTGMGYYKVVSIHDLKIINTFSDGIYKINYNNSAALFISNGGCDGDSAGVETGCWHYFDALGNLRSIEYWDEGVNVWQREFDKNMQLTSYEYKNDKDDGYVMHTYKGGDLFTESFHFNDKGHMHYYPGAALSISNVEPYFHANFLYREEDTFQLGLCPGRNMEILSMEKPHNIRFLLNGKSVKFPLRLKANDSLNLTLIFHPLPETLHDEEILVIRTNDVQHPNYKIYCRTSASHIDGGNISGWQKLTLSQKKDRSFFIGSTGTENDVSIEGENGFTKKYSFWGNDYLKLNLSEFTPGKYSIHIGSCNYSGDVDLIITK